MCLTQLVETLIPILLLSLSTTGYEIVVPVQVDASGQYLSHSIHPVVQQQQQTRRNPSDNEGAPNSHGPATLNYKFNAHGQDFHLEVSPNEGLLAPGFAIQRRKNGRTLEKLEYIPELENCHYSGKAVSHGDESIVAVSICDGLVSRAYFFK